MFQLYINPIERKWKKEDEWVKTVSISEAQTSHFKTLRFNLAVHLLTPTVFT
jgi:hypothetical protein